MNIVLDEYRLFLLEVDDLCAGLAEKHAKHLKCRRGCSACCTDISVLPIEWSSIREGLDDGADVARKAAKPTNPEADLPCAFLVDRSCSIYPLRPLICRTHGLPLAYRVESYDAEGDRLEAEEWQTCWCGLNFTELTPATFVGRFGAEASLNMETLNRKLRELNHRYVASPEGRGFREWKRLELSALLR